MEPRAYTLAEKTLAAAKELRATLEGQAEGVALTVGRGLVGIDCAYNPRLSAIAKSIAGFKFDTEAKIWQGPLEEYDAIAGAAVRMRAISGQLRRARHDIEAKAQAARPGSKIQDAFAKEGAYFVGSVLAANGCFCAQEAGDGMVKIHDLARMKVPPTVGRELYIKYGEGGKSAVVYPARPKSEAAHQGKEAP